MDQHDVTHREAVGLADRAADHLGDPLGVGRRVRSRLGDDDGLLALDAAVHGERGGAARPKRPVGHLGGQLQILRVVVASVDDHQVLEAAGDEQLALALESEVSGPQETVRTVLQRGPEGLAGGEGVAPIALGDARAAHPDLADLPLRHLLPPLGVGDHHGDPGIGRPEPTAAASAAPACGLDPGAAARRGGVSADPPVTMSVASARP